MREKDFAEVWLPSYLKMIQMYAALGARTCPFCEDDWMRYLDYIQEWPAGTKLMFEYGDPKTIKDKLGDKMMIHGLFPINLLKTGTKQEVLDKAKELLDIMLPGCGYTFGFDKNPLTLGDLNFDNYCALAEFVRDYAVYDNPGESYGQPLNSEGYVFSEEVVPPIKSKYLFDFDEYKKEYPLVPDYTKATLERYDREYLNMVMTMLV